MAIRILSNSMLFGFLKTPSRSRQGLKNSLVMLYKKVSQSRQMCHMRDYEKTTTLQNCLSHVEESFMKSKISEPRLSAEYIAAFVLGRKTLQGLSKFSKISNAEYERIMILSEKRLKGLPIQYVIQEWDFCDLTLDMQIPVFIPRPETEELVGLITDDLSFKKSSSLLEVCCGSGAISLTLLNAHKNLHGVCFDKNAEACKLTQRNAVKCQLRERISVYNLEVGEYGNCSEISNKKYDLIVSNPPYILSKDMKDLQPEIIRFEDKEALDGGDDGLNIIRNILKLAAKLLEPNGLLWLEVDSSHPTKIRELCHNHGLYYLKTYTDFNGWPRFCKIKNLEYT